MRAAAALASVAIVGVMWCSVSLGIVGRVLYHSIGSALGAVFTRAVYCRFLVPSAGERTILIATRVAAVTGIGLSFPCAPFLDKGVVAFHLRLSSVAGVPLATVFAIGVLTRANRESGLACMLAGLAAGLVSMFGERFEWGLPCRVRLSAAAGVASASRATDPDGWSGPPSRWHPGPPSAIRVHTATARRN